MKYIPGSIEGDHVLLTGPITGTVTLDDGTEVDVSQPVIAVTDDQAAEIAEKIGLRYAAEGHPDDVELDDNPDSETFGQRVQRPFVYVAPDDVPSENAPSTKSKKG